MKIVYREGKPGFLLDGKFCPLMAGGALLGSYIDVRTVASFASNASASFAHGLPSAPDFVLVLGLQAASSASGVVPNYTADATNVSLFGTATNSTPVMRVVSVVAHSLIR
jgi:hypothetical protein